MIFLKLRIHYKMFLSCHIVDIREVTKIHVFWKLHLRKSKKFGFIRFELPKIAHRFTLPTSNEISDGVLDLERRFTVQRCEWAFKRENVAHRYSHSLAECEKLQHLWESLHISKEDFLNIIVRRFHLFQSKWVVIHVPVSRILASPPSTSSSSLSGMNAVE